MRIRRPEEIWLNRSANRLRKRGLRNVARHVPKRIGRDVTPDFLLASNRHTAILKKVLIKWFGTVYVVFRHYLLVA